MYVPLYTQVLYGPPLTVSRILHNLLECVCIKIILIVLTDAQGFSCQSMLQSLAQS